MIKTAHTSPTLRQERNIISVCCLPVLILTHIPSLSGRQLLYVALSSSTTEQAHTRINTGRSLDFGSYSYE